MFPINKKRGLRWRFYVVIKEIQIVVGESTPLDSRKS